MTGTASRTKLPPTGPRDPEVWLTLLAESRRPGLFDTEPDDLLTANCHCTD